MWLCRKATPDGPGFNEYPAITSDRIWEDVKADTIIFNSMNTTYRDDQGVATPSKNLIYNWDAFTNNYAEYVVKAAKIRVNFHVTTL